MTADSIREDAPGTLARMNADATDAILEPLSPPSNAYIYALSALAVMVAWAGIAWAYQVQAGMGVAGLSHPVSWAVYITNFVFWVGIAHSGTLISAILYLVRSRWRTSISRASEAMTIFAIMTAGLFPLVHLGRLWVVYYILPYPSERQIWPNFVSPLVWDVLAVSTYFTVSLIFWFVGLMPDIAAARDRWAQAVGTDRLRSRVYHALSLGWTGSSRQWFHMNRSYLFFAALSTPLVVSVHSIVSWDFAMSLLPGWHSTLFAPYFVAGAIHSGIAMVFLLIIPLRRIFRLQDLITLNHLESAAKTMIVTASIIGYAYLLEQFFAWYSGEKFEMLYNTFRSTSPWMAPMYWALWVLNVFIPLLFAFKKIRRSLAWMIAIGIAVNIGMWLERFVIIVSGLAHDFLPHNWDVYMPKWPEYSITAGSFAWFFLWFLLFCKYLPSIAIADYKEDILRDVEGLDLDEEKPHGGGGFHRPVRESKGLLAVFVDPEKMAHAIALLKSMGLDQLEFYGPRRSHECEALLHPRKSPVRYWTLAGAVSGCLGGFALAIYAAKVNNLIVGGKPPVSIIPYCIPGFEGTILFGTLGNFLGMMFHSRLGLPKLPRQYNRRFMRDRFGLFVQCCPEEAAAARNVLAPVAPEEMRDV